MTGEVSRRPISRTGPGRARWPSHDDGAPERGACSQSGHAEGLRGAQHDKPWAALGRTVLAVATLDRRLTGDGQYLIHFDDHRIPLALRVSIELGLYRPRHDLLA